MSKCYVYRTCNVTRKLFLQLEANSFCYSLHVVCTLFACCLHVVVLHLTFFLLLTDRFCCSHAWPAYEYVHALSCVNNRTCNVTSKLFLETVIGAIVTDCNCSCADCKWHCADRKNISHNVIGQVQIVLSFFYWGKLQTSLDRGKCHTSLDRGKCHTRSRPAPAGLGFAPRASSSSRHTTSLCQPYDKPRQGERPKRRNLTKLGGKKKRDEEEARGANPRGPARTRRRSRDTAMWKVRKLWQRLMWKLWKFPHALPKWLLQVATFNHT